MSVRCVLMQPYTVTVKMALRAPADVAVHQSISAPATLDDILLYVQLYRNQGCVSLQYAQKFESVLLNPKDGMGRAITWENSVALDGYVRRLQGVAEQLKQKNRCSSSMRLYRPLVFGAHPAGHLLGLLVTAKTSTHVDFQSVQAVKFCQVPLYGMHVSCVAGTCMHAM